MVAENTNTVETKETENPGLDTPAETVVRDEPIESQYAWGGSPRDDGKVDDPDDKGTSEAAAGGDTAAEAEGIETPAGETKEGGKDWYDRDLQRWANDLGLSDEQARAYGSEELLLKTLDVLESRGPKEDREPPARREEPREAPKQTAGERKRFMEKLDLTKHLFNKEELKELSEVAPQFVDRLNGAFSTMNDHFDRHIETIEASFVELAELYKEQQGAIARREGEASSHRYYGYIKELVEKEDPSLKEMFAVTPWDSRPGSRVHRFYTEIDQQIGVLRDGWKGKKGAPSEREIVQRAARLVLGDRIRSSVRKEFAAKMETRSRNAIGAGTQRNGQPATRSKQDRDAAADKFLEESYRRRGLLNR